MRITVKARLYFLKEQFLQQKLKMVCSGKICWIFKMQFLFLLTSKPPLQPQVFFFFFFNVSLSSCASFVGCRGGAQAVYYGPTCSVGNLCHEIIHALGLHHEHTRPDRDQYIDVQWRSIIPGEHSTCKHNKVPFTDVHWLKSNMTSPVHSGSCSFFFFYH